MEIRKADEGDWDAIWPIFHAVVSAGETYAFDPEMSDEAAHKLWMGPPATAYAAIEEGRIVGTYMMRPNQPGLGDHVANAGFMVTPDYGKRGVGRAMGLHALEEARRAGYLAMQFNFVVSTNERAVALWKSLGFEIVGTISQGFRHKTLGLTDVYIMHRLL